MCSRKPTSTLSVCVDWPSSTLRLLLQSTFHQGLVIFADLLTRHAIYRDRLRDYLHNFTLRHWDPAMRILAAGTLRSALLLGDAGDIDNSINREVSGGALGYG